MNLLTLKTYVICLDANLTCLGAIVSKLQPSKKFLYFERRPFWKVGKNHISHARIPWGFFGVDTGTIRNSKLLESVCLQFCLGSPYIWAILTRLIVLNSVCLYGISNNHAVLAFYLNLTLVELMLIKISFVQLPTFQGMIYVLCLDSTQQMSRSILIMFGTMCIIVENIISPNSGTTIL